MSFDLRLTRSVSIAEVLHATRIRLRRAMLLAAALVVAISSPVVGQVGTHSVRGRIAERGQDRAIAGAAVRLGEDGRATTDSAGRFEIRSVRPGRYSFVVEALGYRTVRTVVNVDGTEDIRAAIEMDPEPIALDSLNVHLARVELRGRVIDATSRRPVPYAVVRQDEENSVASRDNGTFSLGQVPRGRHTLLVEGFGWLPSRIGIDIAGDTTIQVELRPDPITVGRIDAQVERLSERSRGLGYALRTLDRADILSSQAPTAVQYLKGRGVPIRECPSTPSRLCLNATPPIVFIDDIQVCGLEVLDLYPNATLQRIEIIGRNRSTIRAYTTWYIERMTRRPVTLPPFTGWDRPLPCAAG